MNRLDYRGFIVNGGFIEIRKINNQYHTFVKADHMYFKNNLIDYYDIDGNFIKSEILQENITKRKLKKTSSINSLNAFKVICYNYKFYAIHYPYATKDINGVTDFCRALNGCEIITGIKPEFNVDVESYNLGSPELVVYKGFSREITQVNYRSIIDFEYASFLKNKTTFLESIINDGYYEYYENEVNNLFKINCKNVSEYFYLSIDDLIKNKYNKIDCMVKRLNERITNNINHVGSHKQFRTIRM